MMEMRDYLSEIMTEYAKTLLTPHTADIVTSGDTVWVGYIVHCTSN